MLLEGAFEEALEMTGRVSPDDTAGTLCLWLGEPPAHKIGSKIDSIVRVRVSKI
jgi:hypothetical protein